MPTFTHDNINFQYETIGSGKPLVLCHGLGGDCQQPRDLFGEIPGHQLIVWDCRGHGSTEPLGDESNFTFPAFALDLQALLDHLRIDRAVIGGISMGAATAITFALRSPQRVSALLLIRPAWLNHPVPPNLAVFPIVAQLLDQLDPDEALRRLESNPLFLQIQQISRDCAESVRQQLFKPHAKQRSVRLRQMPASVPFNQWEQLTKLTLPSLVIGNDADPVHPLDMARQLASHLPQASLHEVPSKAHDPQAHARAIRTIVADFLN